MTTDGPGVLLKLGGELLESVTGRQNIARAMRRLQGSGRLVVVHGGGREVDAEMAAKGIPKQAVDGLRLTDAHTLEVVVGVLAGRVNTRLVAAARVEGIRAVGLTAVDAGVSSVRRADPYRAADGSEVDLGFVGQPTGTEPPQLVTQLCEAGFVPVIASIGADADGQLLNVNADTLAGHLAARLTVARLLIAGGTPGVLDEHGATIACVTEPLLEALIADGRASAGMVAKLIACREARRGGVAKVRIVNGKGTTDLDESPGTTIGGH
jgi:acetylglutamate kinase